MQVDLAALASAPERVSELEDQVRELKAAVDLLKAGSGLRRYATVREICEEYAISKRTFFEWTAKGRPFESAVVRPVAGDRPAARVNRERWRKIFEGTR